LTLQTSDFKFITYEPCFNNYDIIYSKYLEVYEEFKKLGEENVNFRVLSYFYEGMLYLINGDKFFSEKEYKKANKNYEEAHKLITRSRASRGIENDNIWLEMVKWIAYCESYLNLSKSYLVKDFSEKIKLIKKSKVAIKDFVEKRKSDENVILNVYAKAKENYISYIYYISLAQKYEKDTRMQKKILLKARRKLLLADFILNRFSEEIDDLDFKIDELTKIHIVERAEMYWNKGTLLISQSDFMSAHKYLLLASQYYERASKVCSEFIELRLYLALSKITESSSLEAKANELYRRQDQPLEASKLFEKAYEVVDESLGLLATIHNEVLINNMTAQRSYYEALALEAKGISLFDEEKYKEAINVFEQSMQKLKETERLVIEGSSEHLQEYIRLAKNEIEGYLSMAKTML